MSDGPVPSGPLAVAPEVAAGAPAALTAGRLLREARQAQGLHIAALASAIKVAPRKLELLEADRLDELPDATFARALAQTVCRSLKVDSAPILVLLPRASGGRLEQVGGGLNTPFHERPGRLVPSDWASLSTPRFWGPALLLLAAALVYLMPAGWLPTGSARSPVAPDGAASSVAAPASPPSVPVTLAAPADTNAPSSAATGGLPASPSSSDPITGSSLVLAKGPAAGTIVASVSRQPAAAEGTAPGSTTGNATNGALPVATQEAAVGMKLLQLHASQDSWIEVSDASGRALLSRVVRAGEAVGLDGATPLQLRVGNVSATEVVFRGKVLALAPFTRDNLARLELK